MDSVDLLKSLRRLVAIHGAAQVSVWLGYRDSRSVNTWLATKRIPKARTALVEQIVMDKMTQL